MKMFNYLNTLKDYLTSIRKLENYLSFDVSFASTWKIPKKFVQEDKFLNNGETEDGRISLSFVCEFDEPSVELIYENIVGIIKFNLEKEEKDRLFEEKVKELKTIFDKQNLDSLKELKIGINESQPTVDEPRNQKRTKETPIITTEE